ncbi:winged helix-turn-helix transcriptional regulator [Actinomycetospora lutea]|uniref:winged helix-turn-helix transcriptional regulator n=1 Tax=Actinomycetospora lutea TaxID=663604 RepID=UPI00236622A6|nr:winged helix-turn-helix transcriptional regulator [Actinomycetospora lutea]MDD7937197.1 winged helix-turn-helix transcriptional regulator [Actinomycetospora lutea]
MAARRDYFDGCGAAHALDLVGERWALLVVRELVLGPKRFTDLRAGLPHASPNVLSQRLRELEDAGVLRRRRLPPPAASAVYELTEWGQELEPVLQALGRWAARSLPESDSIKVDSFVLSLRTMFHPELAADADTTLQLVLDEQPFRVRLAHGELDIERGEVAGAAATVRCSPTILAGVVYRGLPVADAQADGLLEVTGDPAALDALIGAFRLPEPLPA